ncbi:palmitoyltransferase ERF2 [Colletotrichum tofieldiae]|nr:palmitoyltransferase ERF2 [Colletotrichum tofieldiae]
MAYRFDGYSEASSARNSPRNQRQPPLASRQRRRGQNGPACGGGIPEGAYFGTGRFYEENLRNEQQRQQEREQQEQQTPRCPSSDPFSGLNGLGFSAGGGWSEEEWERVFFEALRRVQEKRRQERRGGGGIGDGGLGWGLGAMRWEADSDSRASELARRCALRICLVVFSVVAEVIGTEEEVAKEVSASKKCSGRQETSLAEQDTAPASALGTRSMSGVEGRV